MSQASRPRPNIMPARPAVPAAFQFLFWRRRPVAQQGHIVFAGLQFSLKVALPVVASLWRAPARLIARFVALGQ